MATARIATSTRALLYRGRIPDLRFSGSASSLACHPLPHRGGGRNLSWSSSLTLTISTLSQAARWSDVRLPVAASMLLHQRVACFSSVPKRYQKRDDETDEDYELRVKELRMQDADKRYQTLLQQASSSTSATSAQQQDQEELIEAMEQLRQSYEDLLFWDKAIEIEEQILLHRQTSVEARTKNKTTSTSSTMEEDEEPLRKMATSLVKLGDLYGEMGNNYVEARRHYKQAFDIYSQIHKARQQQPATQQEPAPNQTASLSSSSSTSSLSPSHNNPPMHADMGQVLHSVAMTFARQEEFDKATAVLRQAKEHFEYHGLPLPLDEHNIVPPGHKVHPGIFQVFEDHALLFRMMERYEMALSVYQESSSVAQDLQLEPDSEFWIDLDMNTADCQLALGHTARALYTYQSLLEKAVARRLKAKESSNDEGDDEDAMSLESVMRHNIGHIHAKEGRYQEALDEFTKSYNLKKQVSKSESHPELVNTLHGMGAVNATLGNYAEARGHFREALTIARLHADPTLGDDDPKVSYALRNLEQVQSDRRSQAF